MNRIRHNTSYAARLVEFVTRSHGVITGEGWEERMKVREVAWPPLEFLLPFRPAEFQRLGKHHLSDKIFLAKFAIGCSVRSLPRFASTSTDRNFFCNACERDVFYVEGYYNDEPTMAPTSSCSSRR